MDTVPARGANVKLDSWNSMPHDFQAFGDYLPESKEALSRITDVIGERMTYLSQRTR